MKEFSNIRYETDDYKIVDQMYGNAIAFKFNGKWQIHSPIPDFFRSRIEELKKEAVNEKN